jgi:nucleotidyltransferase AbiEii toxin of type IV toxin-antitoxin system
MTQRDVTNLPASVHQRLLNLSRQTKRPFNELLQYYAIERFLFRLSRSPHAPEFVLKGALMLRVWNVSIARPTMDIDMLGQLPNSVEALVKVVRECLAAEVPNDGLHFDTESVRGDAITLKAKYQGVRIRVGGNLGNARLSLQLDFGFGDVIVPQSVWIEYPELLDFGRPHLLGYTPESAIAEKFQAMVELEMANTRLKDFFDIWRLSQSLRFDGLILCQAIAATFKQRGTPLPTSPPLALTPTFSADPIKDAQWRAFLRKALLVADTKTLAETVEDLSAFILPPTFAAAEGKAFKMRWPPSGGWELVG